MTLSSEILLGAFECLDCGTISSNEDITATTTRLVTMADQFNATQLAAAKFCAELNKLLAALEFFVEEFTPDCIIRRYYTLNSKITPHDIEQLTSMSIWEFRLFIEYWGLLSAALIDPVEAYCNADEHISFRKLETYVSESKKKEIQDIGEF